MSEVLTECLEYNDVAQVSMLQSTSTVKEEGGI